MCECGSEQANFIGKFLNKIAKKCRMEKDFDKLFLTLKVGMVKIIPKKCNLFDFAVYL